MRLALALVVALALPTVGASSVQLVLVAHDDGFSLPGATERNPTLHLAPGANVTLTFENDASTPQDLVLGAPLDVRTPCCQRPGDSAVLQFTIPSDASGQVPYSSDQAPDALHGVLQLGEVPPSIALATPEDRATVGAVVAARAEVAGVDAPRVVWALDGANVTDATSELGHAFDVSEGHHLIHVELLDANDGYRSPRVFAEAVVFRGRDALTTPGDANATPTAAGSPTGLTPGFGASSLVLALALALALVSASRSRRRP